MPTEPPAPEPYINEQATAIAAMVEEANIASKLRKERLREIGEQCWAGYETDRDSSQAWRDSADDWIKMATQATEEKNYPWPNASNIKYPLVSVAAMQFSARSYPTLIPSDGKIVKPLVIGKDPDGSKLKRAERVAKYMSWQLLHDMDNWEEDMDRLLMLDAIVGTVFKKTFYDPYTEKMCSKLVDGRELVINFYAESVEKAERVSEHVYLYERQVDERKGMGIYRDVDIGVPTRADFDDASDHGADDDAVPFFLIEQHTWLDLDDDGIKEPYVVTFHKGSKEVLRISARYAPDSLVLKKGKIARIKPIEYYTKYGFIPNPSSRIYDLGFGHLLGPINDSVNTIINQLVDAGTLSNLQSGFIGKGLRIKMGDTVMRPGEWRAVNATGDDLKKQIVPLPSKDPSQTLFNLLGTLVTSGKELASVAEIFVGKMPGQNTPATTTMATIEQGMKVFTAIYKRVYRSLYKEFQKLYRLNGLFLDPQTVIAVLDEPTGPQDFALEGYDICPGADPTAVSSTERLIKAQGLLELLPLGTIDPIEVTKRVLEAQDQPNWEALLPGVKETGQVQIPQKPDPKAQEMQMKMQMDQKAAELKQQTTAMKAEQDQKSAAAKAANEKAMADIKIQAERDKMLLQKAADEHKQKLFIRDAQVKSAVSEQQQVQKLRHAEETHKSKQREKNSSSGGGAK